MSQFFPVFFALGIAALSGGRLAAPVWKDRLLWLSACLFVLALGLILLRSADRITAIFSS